MIVDNSIQKLIYENLEREQNERESTHEPSGKLSASWLFQPLRFQVMKNIGVPRKTLEPYVLGKFKRGHDVEAWYVNQLKEVGVLVETQKLLEYKNAIGYADVIVDPTKFNFKECRVHEVKSVTNAKLKMIANTDVDYHYRLQGTFYAMAMGEQYYAIDIVSAEDLRVSTYIFDIKDTQKDVDEIISKYDAAMLAWNEKKVLPPFEVNPRIPWTSNFEYAPFSEEWCTMDDATLIKKLS